MPGPCPRLSLPAALLLACVRGPAPAPAVFPTPAPAPVSVLGDRSETTGLEGQLAADPEEAPPPVKPPVKPPPVPLAAVTLAADAGLRLVHETRGWDFLAAPGRLVTLDEDFMHLTAVDAVTGRQVWRVEAQTRPNGRHTLHAQGHQLILHAGPSRIHVALRDGAIAGRASGSFNGNDLQCGLQLREGDQEPEWGGWAPPHRAGAACAEVCACSLRLFACSDGAALGRGLHVSETHLYHSLSEPHDTVCFNRPALLVRGARATIVRAEDEQHEPVIMGLDPGTGALRWQRRELAARFSSYSSHAGTDPSGKLCWLADSAELVVFACATGATQWGLRIGDPERPAYTGITWRAGTLLVQHRDAAGTQLSLHDDSGGARRWQRRMAADRMAIAEGSAPPRHAYGGEAVAAYVIIDPEHGTTRGEIAVVPGKDTLLRAPGGEYLRVGDARLAEFARDGAPTGERPIAGPVVAVTRAHLVALDRDQVRVLRRDTLRPALTLAGSWSLRASEDALDADALVLIEHRGDEPGRALLLRP